MGPPETSTEIKMGQQHRKGGGQVAFGLVESSDDTAGALPSCSSTHTCQPRPLIPLWRAGATKIYLQNQLRGRQYHRRAETLDARFDRLGEAIVLQWKLQLRRPVTKVKESVSSMQSVPTKV